MMETSPTRVVLRADGDTEIGGGHVMRSLALGRALAPRAEVVVVMRVGQPGLAEHVRRAGIDLVEIDAPYPHQMDVETVVRLIVHPAHDWVVVDGYHFDENYVQQLRDRGARTAIVDDGPRLETYAADVLVDHNPGALRQPYVTEPSTRLLLGPRFSLLRPEFSATLHRRRSGRCKRLFVFMGAADPSNTTRLVLDAIAPAHDRFETTVLLGGANPHADRLMDEFAGISRLQFVRNALDVTPLMAAADLAVVMAGGVMWELAALGVPALVITATEVQRQVAKTANSYGAHRWVGDVASLSAGVLGEAVESLAGDVAALSEMTKLGPSLIDGRGASRVADALMAGAADTECSIRSARPEDAEAIWEIATDSFVREQAFTTEAFSYVQHERWFLERLARLTSRMWVVERDGVVGGSVRYDADGAAALVSIAVAAPFRGRGIATRLLGETWANACRQLHVERARGVVFERNRASQNAFIRAGFAEVLHETIDGHACVVFEAGVRQSVV